MRKTLRILLVCLLAALYGSTLFAQDTVGSSVRLGEVKKSSRKPFVYRFGISAAFRPDDSMEYTSVNSTLKFDGREFAANCFFESKIYANLFLGISAGWSQSFYESIYEYQNIDVRIGRVCLSPYIAYYWERISLRAGCEFAIPLSFVNRESNIWNTGFNSDCLRKCPAELFIGLGYGFHPNFSIGVNLAWSFGSGPFDLDKLSYYGRSRFQCSAGSLKSAIVLRVPLFANGK